ncbi:MAG TPA: cupredoxin domain-containing protein [Polyangiaceae bacterium]|jgi:plastocyanin domain-containing protein|nr:cupredoxin domain-containing protein [Polyangiaceae bacterium]
MHRFGLVVLAALAAAACKKAPSVPASDGRPEVEVKVDATGYHPDKLHAKAGKPLRMLVTRTTDDGCGQEIVVPSLHLKYELPLNQPVAIDLTMPEKGELAFACGMDMYKGSIVAD